MEQPNDQLNRRIDDYIEGLFIPPDDSLQAGLKAAESAALPSINVSPNEGKLLHLIARITGAKRILEIGTLGGYSTIWLARALPSSGRLITLELDPKHAEVARANLERAGVVERVEIRVGRAADTLQKMIAAKEGTFDLVFIDADKVSYTEYLELSLKLSRVGTVILADNLIRNGRVMEETPLDEPARAVRLFNVALAAHPRLDSIILPIIRNTIDGLSISIVK